MNVRPRALTEDTREKRTVISSDHTSQWHYEAKQADCDYCYRLNIIFKQYFFAVNQQCQIQQTFTVKETFN